MNGFPVKSCAPVELAVAEFTERGFEYDHEWAVGDERRIYTQRMEPRLALVRPQIQDGHLVIGAPGMQDIAVPLDGNPDADEVAIDLFGKPGTGLDEGPDAGAFFAEFLERPKARLYRVGQPRLIREARRVEGASTQMGFTDSVPLSLGSMASLAALNLHLAEDIGMDRFRMNIVVDGDKDELPPYDEDYWEAFQAGGLSGFVVGPIARCSMPNVDQQSGELPKIHAVSEALRTTRTGVDPKSTKEKPDDFFGEGVAHEFRPGMTLRLGDTVTVTRRSEERNFRTSP